MEGWRLGIKPYRGRCEQACWSCAPLVWKNRAKRLVPRRTNCAVFQTKSLFSAVSDSFYLGGSCFVAANEKSHVAASQQHSYLIYQWKLWGNGESLLESSSVKQPGRLCAFFVQHKLQEKKRKKDAQQYILGTQVYQTMQDLAAGVTNAGRTPLHLPQSLLPWVPLSKTDSFWTTLGLLDIKADRLLPFV